MINDICDKSYETLTLTEEDLNTYLFEKQAAGLKATAAAKYRSHLKHLCRWLPLGKVITKELLLQWRAELESFGYSKATIEKYVTSANSYTKHRGRSDLNIKKSNALDLRGKQYGFLTVLEPTGEKYRTANMWLCRCKCGNEIEVPTTSLTRGNTTSCGCLSMDILDYHNRYVGGTELRQSLADQPISKRAASGYTGVSKRGDKWLAYITYKKKVYRLGYYDKIEDAVKARARAKEEVMADAAMLYEATDHLYAVKPQKSKKPMKEPQKERKLSPKSRRNDNTSGHAGVKYTGSSWKAEIALNGIRYHLGLYDTYEKAVTAREQAEMLALIKDEVGIAQISCSATTYTVKAKQKI